MATRELVVGGVARVYRGGIGRMLARDEMAGADLDLKHSFGVALQAGADYWVNDKSAIRGTLRWIDIDADVTLDLELDVTDLADPPERLEILNADQGVDDLARLAGTIGYEVLTSLGRRYARRHQG